MFDNIGMDMLVRDLHTSLLDSLVSFEEIGCEYGSWSGIRNTSFYYQLANGLNMPKSYITGLNSPGTITLGFIRKLQTVVNTAPVL